MRSKNGVIGLKAIGDGRRADVMYKYFGKTPGCYCRDCENIVGAIRANCKHYKCQLYGVTNSSATDWTLKTEACGLYNVALTQEELKREMIRRLEDD